MRRVCSGAPATQNIAKWRQRSPKFCAWHENCNSSCESDAKVLRLPHKTAFDTLSNRLECQKAPRLPRKTTRQPAWKPSKRRCFAASPRHGDATGKPETRDETRGSIKTFLEPKNLKPQNRSFLSGLRQFSSHLTKCNACHGICTFSPLDAALTMGFAKITPHDTSKVLRLPRKMTMDMSKVLRLPRKLQRIFWNVAKVLPLPHKTTFHTARHTSECHEVPRLPRETKQHDVSNLQKRPLLQNLP